MSNCLQKNKYRYILWYNDNMQRINILEGNWKFRNRLRNTNTEIYPKLVLTSTEIFSIFKLKWTNYIFSEFLFIYILFAKKVMWLWLLNRTLWIIMRVMVNQSFSDPWIFCSFWNILNFKLYPIESKVSAENVNIYAESYKSCRECA